MTRPRPSRTVTDTVTASTAARKVVGAWVPDDSPWAYAGTTNARTRALRARDVREI